MAGYPSNTAALVAGFAILAPMTFADLKRDLAATELRIMGVVGDHLVLIGPTGPGFWSHFLHSPEWNDRDPNPIDRWSDRILTDLATRYNAKTHFPFGPDPAPFLAWAMASDRAWQSPVGMLVHTDAGLMVSYRGALELPFKVQTKGYENPCTGCAQPCVTACPIGALSDNGYDVPACQAYLQKEEGRECLENGCLVRRSCPVSQTYGRDPKQSGYHMQQFLPK